jgi:hypothetical protein
MPVAAVGGGENPRLDGASCLLSLAEKLMFLTGKNEHSLRGRPHLT